MIPGCGFVLGLLDRLKVVSKCCSFATAGGEIGESKASLPAPYRPCARAASYRKERAFPQAQRRCRTRQPHTEEFYQVPPCSLEMKQLNREWRHWEKIYNTVRPHQALSYLTLQQFLRQNSSQRKE